METNELVERIIACAMTVRKHLTPGFEENVYKNAMFIELKSIGLPIETEAHFKVYYKEREVGSYRADMVVDRRVIIELKAINSLAPIHEVQLVNYLTATGIDDGLLINFGSEKIEIRRKYRLYKRPTTTYN